jgi:phosphate:Na+ symporter
MLLPVIPSLPCLAAAGADIDLVALLVGVFGGLALFLYGMELMSDALKAVAGDRMRGILAQLTASRLRGTATGALVTAAVQSSSVTTVLVVGFVSAGLMTMTQSVSVIMGANIGSTITAQIIAFNVTKAALGIIALGFAVTFVGRGSRTKRYGTTLLGLGLIFFGIGVMSDAMRPLRDYAPFLDAMARLETPGLGILAGAAFTALVQSSAATAGIVIVLASQGIVTLPAGIAVILGANVGTCVTALLASLGKPREALRAALVHVLFNVAGVLLWVGLIDALAAAATRISPAGDTPREIANAHTIFNVACTALFLPFARVFARVVERLVPDPPGDGEEEVHAKYLEGDLVAAPSLALDRVRMEILHVGNRVKAMLAAVLPAMLRGTREDLVAIAARDEPIDLLYAEIVTYLTSLGREELTESQTADHVRLMEAANDLENIGDVIETNLVAQGLDRIDKGLRIGPATQQVIQEFHREVAKALDTALLAVTQKNGEAATLVRNMKGEINRLAEAAAAHGADRLRAREPQRLPTYAVEMNMIENLKRVYYFSKRMARAVLNPEAQG